MVFEKESTPSAATQPSFLWMALGDLVPNIPGLGDWSEKVITGVTTDSRLVRSDYVFIDEGSAYSQKYIEEAVFRGAACVILATKTEACPAFSAIEHWTQEEDHRRSILKIYMPNLSSRVGSLLHRFYQDPTQQLKVIGVTGTNAKTSITTLVASVCRLLDSPCALLGSRGWGVGEVLEETGYTSPPSAKLAYYCWKSVECGAQKLAMEVSSHAIKARRIAGVAFDTLVLSNISRDHLDYHASVEEYVQVKSSLFHTTSAQDMVLNMDDPVGRKIAREYIGSAKIWGYTLENNAPGCSIEVVRGYNVQASLRGLSMDVFYNDQVVTIKSQWLGFFNAHNIIAGVVTLLTLGYTLEQIAEKVPHVAPVPGRMELLPRQQEQPHVVIDYAHSPQALDAVLKSLRQVCERALIVVFGCGGDRDRGKRRQMGAVAEKYANRIILTNDNPRSENPKRILDGILKGIMTPWDVEVEPDRSNAIASAISNARKGDVVLIAGKGDETQQIIGEKRSSFSDRESAQYFLSLRAAHATV